MQGSSIAGRHPNESPQLRIAVERWGLSACGMRQVLQALNACGARIAWSAHRPGARADLVIHMVDMLALAGPSHCAGWNLLGPVEALRAARAAGIPALALVKGDAAGLPSLRSGCWVISGPRDLVTAARILAGAALVVAGGDASARLRRLAEVAAMDATAVLHRVVATSARSLAATLRALLACAGEEGYAAPSSAYLGVGAGARPHLCGDHPFAVRMLDSQDTDTEADLMLAYPWPDLYDAQPASHRPVAAS